MRGIILFNEFNPINVRLSESVLIRVFEHRQSFLAALPTYKHLRKFRAKIDRCGVNLSKSRTKDSSVCFQLTLLVPVLRKNRKIGYGYFNRTPESNCSVSIGDAHKLGKQEYCVNLLLVGDPQTATSDNNSIVSIFYCFTILGVRQLVCDDPKGVYIFEETTNSNDEFSTRIVLRAGSECSIVSHLSGRRQPRDNGCEKRHQSTDDAPGEADPWLAVPLHPEGKAHNCQGTDGARSGPYRDIGNPSHPLTLPPRPAVVERYLHA